MELEFLNVNKNYAFKDTNLSVSAISILPDPVKDSKRLKSNTDFILNDESVQFVCQGPDDLGKFDIKAAQALNIPRGPMYGNFLIL